MSYVSASLAQQASHKGPFRTSLRDAAFWVSRGGAGAMPEDSQQSGRVHLGCHPPMVVPGRLRITLTAGRRGVVGTGRRVPCSSSARGRCLRIPNKRPGWVWAVMLRPWCRMAGRG